MPDVNSPALLVPGNYYSFEFFVEFTVGGKVYLGYPKQALIKSTDPPPRDVRWGSRIDLAYPNPSVPRVPWVDDPNTGLLQRVPATPEDLLGIEGTLGGTRFRFEQILEVGHNQVVYSLFNPDKQGRIAYGFSREIFGPK